MFPYAVAGLWFLIALLLIWAAHHATMPVWEEPEPEDPFEGEITRFRRQVHDWTRDN